MADVCCGPDEVDEHTGSAVSAESAGSASVTPVWRIRELQAAAAAGVLLLAGLLAPADTVVETVLFAAAVVVGGATFVPGAIRVAGTDDRVLPPALRERHRSLSAVARHGGKDGIWQASLLWPRLSRATPGRTVCEDEPEVAHVPILDGAELRATNEIIAGTRADHRRPSGAGTRGRLTAQAQ